MKKTSSKSCLCSCCTSSSTNQTTNTTHLVGYWHNWNGARGEQGGIAKYIDLTEVPKHFNVVQVAFLKADKDGDIPDFKPEMPNHPGWTQAQKDQEFTRQVDILHDEGRIVILSLGGALGHLSLKSDQTTAFTNKIRDLMAKYHFDGIDIDLENISIQVEDNVHVITTALRTIKNESRSKNKHFYITMTPEFPNLRPSGTSYKPYLDILEYIYDFIHPQIYNQGGDGVSPTQEDIDFFKNNYGITLPWWITQNDQALKSVFIALITKHMVQGGTPNNFTAIPANKLILGFPANGDAANNGQITSDQLALALEYLKRMNISIQGLMTWSINWDKNTNYEFMEMYNELFS